MRADARPLPSMMALAAAVIGAAIVGIASGVLWRRDVTSVLSVGLLALAVITPLIRVNRRGVLVGLAAAVLAVGYGLVAAERSGTGPFVTGVALVVFLPTAVATLALLEHEGRRSLAPLGAPSTMRFRSAAGATGILALVVVSAVTFIHPRSGSG